MTVNKLVASRAAEMVAMTVDTTVDSKAYKMVEYLDTEKVDCLVV
jgi:hypothetical protein